MKQILFYALKEDMVTVFEMVEREGALFYVHMGQTLNADYITFDRGADLPNLGKASSDSAISCDSFLTATNGSINLRTIQFGDGNTRFAIDQLANPDTVVLTPAGIRNSGVVLHGRVATVSDTPLSKQLMKRFRSAIAKKFTKIKSFYVGPIAMEALVAGNRLTVSVQSPLEFDLTKG